MKLTNKFNLPQTFVNVAMRPAYTKGKAHVSATELLNSPRIVQLKKKHDDDIVEDVSLDKLKEIYNNFFLFEKMYPSVDKIEFA